MWFKAYRIALTLDVKIFSVGCQMADCGDKRHKIQVFGVVYFKVSTFVVY